MKNLFYTIASIGFGYSSYLMFKYWGGGYGFTSLIAYQLLGAVIFLIVWVTLLFKKKTKMNILLSIISFLLFALSSSLIVYTVSKIA